MKITTSKPGRYVNPRKTRHLTAAQRRGLEMVQGCRTAEPLKGEKQWTR